ncbi:maleylpyruvate isomerase N-terminal domain-containing protein [Cryptosporangium minutisporangium]|uniref:Mycothiol-dependent maleylpyruvate isomerase metal-binding domain-containing protein n=1 Tax=Cryptosporangium minutisporangium TaxID=113569 RepID=A0ABP6SX63_9ACTN
MDPVTGDDVTASVSLLRRSFSDVPDSAWRVAAGDLRWSCWETLEHLVDDLFTYAIQVAASDPPRDDVVPFDYRTTRDGGPANSLFLQPSAGTAGLLQALEVCGVFLATAVRDAPPDRRAHHGYGLSDPEGFAAMGVVETLVHGDDLARGLQRPWAPPADLCARSLHRLFPHAPLETEPWPTLLWATGRGSLPGHPDQGDGWRWDARPAVER